MEEQSGIVKYYYVDDGIQEKIHFSATSGNVLSASASGQKILCAKGHCDVIQCFRFLIKHSNAFKDIN